MLETMMDCVWRLIEEQQKRKRRNADKIIPYARGMLTHLGKIYIKSEQSNWFGTIRKQIKNIKKVKFDKAPTSAQMFKYVYTDSMVSPGTRWDVRIMAKALKCEGHKPTHEEFVDFDMRIKEFVRYISKGIVDKNWNVDDHKTEIDEELRRLFLDREEV